MSKTLNITLEQGADFQALLTIKDDVGATIDLTGYTFRGQGRVTYLDPAPTFSFSFVIRNQVTNKGQVDWTLPNTALVALQLKADKQYLYDVEMQSAGGIVTRVLEGVATVSPEATK